MRLPPLQLLTSHDLCMRLPRHPPAFILSNCLHLRSYLSLLHFSPWPAILISEPSQGALVYESSKGQSTASNLPPNFSCFLCSSPQIRAQVTHHPLPSELAMHRVHGPRRQRGRERISTGRLDPATIDVLLVELSTQPWCGSHPHGAGAPAGITLQRTSCWSASSIAGISVWVAPSWRFGAEHLGTAAASDSCRRHHNEREVTESLVLTISTSQAS